MSAAKHLAVDPSTADTGPNWTGNGISRKVYPRCLPNDTAGGRAQITGSAWNEREMFMSPSNTHLHLVTGDHSLPGMKAAWTKVGWRMTESGRMGGRIDHSRDIYIHVPFVTLGEHHRWFLSS